ncbi:MAG TPA: helix-turn-helix domain-containing protein [Ktedonobacteraceae bacterium]|nr:helix-turn-helix domain-containing protein [Ktedonobacteraceae bacterium]
MSGELHLPLAAHQQRYVPGAPLADFVNTFHLYGEADMVQSQALSRERVLPTGTTELVIYLRDDALRLFDKKSYELSQSVTGPMICGAHSEPFIIDTAQKSDVLTVNFKPGGAFPFFGLPASELHNTCISLETLWGSVARDIHDQLREAETPFIKFRVLEKYLLDRLLCSARRHPAAAFALKRFVQEPWQPIADVTAQLGVSSKHFIHVFEREVGMTPKLFCRVQRFQRIIHHLKRDQHPVDWIEMALACGYYDQAHFIHDFQVFCGLNPTTYLLQQGLQINHLPFQG